MDFNRQAESYDERTGFPSEAIESIVNGLCELLTDASETVVLELGAGTGTLGLALAKKVARYIGMDKSSGMLSQAASSGSLPAEATMLVADVSEAWPVESGTVQCFFTSRALHLFDLDNVCNEVQRTADPAAAVFLVGRVEREPGSMHNILRKEMRRHLRDAGYVARDGNSAWQKLVAVMSEWNGELLPPHTVASWQRSRSPAQMLSAWENKPGLGGHSISSEEKTDILSRLCTWAKENWYNDFDKKCEINESYVLYGIKFQLSSHNE